MTALTGPEDDLGKMLTYVQTHRSAGHNDPSSPKFEAYLTDLATLVDDAHRVRYQYHPPATIDERLSFLVSTVAAIDRRTETFVGALEDLQATIAQLDADQAAEAAEVLTAVQKLIDAAGSAAALQATIDSLTAGDAVTAAALAELNTHAAAIDAAVNASAAALAPVVTPPTP